MVQHTETLELQALMSVLESSDAIRDKINIRNAYDPANDTLRGITRLGDDCAAIRNGDGSYMLFAGEAMLSAFVAADPWFAGYSAVMVNVSDICAMGGRSTAIVDMLWSPSLADTEPVWEGMRQAARDYAVPIVGGHTTVSPGEASVYLAASIVGNANRLMTSFDAKPGQQILMAVDLDGQYRDGKPFWNASVGKDPDRLQQITSLLPQIAEQELCNVCKDISNGGIVGTLVMLLDCSGVGGRLLLDALPKPEEVPLDRWLLSFPSYGYLFAVDPEKTESMKETFAQHRIDCEVVGEITDTRVLELCLGSEKSVIWEQKETGGDA